MPFFRRIFELFPGYKKFGLIRVLERFLEEHPRIPAGALVFPALRFFLLASGRPPDPELIAGLELLLVRKIGGDAARTVMRDLPASCLPSAETVCEQARLSASFSASDRKAMLKLFLSFFSSLASLPDPVRREFTVVAAVLGFDAAGADELLAADRVEREARTEQVTSGAGLLAALVVIVLFLLAALFLKSVFFGFLFAWLFLPLERFYERHIFQTAGYVAFAGFLTRLSIPVRNLRRTLSRRAGFPLAEDVRSPNGMDNAVRNSRAMKASALTLVSLLAALCLTVCLLFAFLAPFAVSAGRSFADWAQSSGLLKGAETMVAEVLDREAAPAAETAVSAAPLTEKQPDRVRDHLRRNLKSYVSANALRLTQAVVHKGGDLLSTLAALGGMIGSFAFDILLCLFFFFFFLQKMAFYASSPKLEKAGRLSIGSWTVSSIFSSDWFPVTNERTHRAAGAIIDRVYLMLNAWLRGYFWIIVLETLLYSVCFLLFGVPYAPLLALIAGSTILLPFLGPVASFAITVLVCLAFAESHLAFTLIGVSLTYLAINGVLEQLFLYPTLVGGAIGLTTLETIIVVLIGAAMGGIVGMILAVPAAALLKYLIPKIYQVWSRTRDRT